MSDYPDHTEFLSKSKKTEVMRRLRSVAGG